MKSKAWWAAFLALLILITRLKPFWNASHFFEVPIDFDEGVYFAAGRLITLGILPYRDFDLGHPPGIAWIMAVVQFILPTTSTALAFTWTKLLYCLAGTITALLIFHIFNKKHGLAFGILSSLLYATYPEVIALDRGVFLEPLVNLAVICAVWMHQKEKSYMGIGVILALAISIKFTAVVWLPAFAFWAWQSRTPSRNLGYWMGGGLLGFMIFIMPWIIPAPSDFFRDVVGFQLSRPPDGDLEIELRLHSILQSSHLPMNVMSILAILSFPWVPREQRSNYFGYLLTCVLAVMVLLSSRGFWGQYNALLALPQALLSVHCLYGLKPLQQKVKLLHSLLIAFFVLLILSGVHSGIKGGRARAPEQVNIMKFLFKVPDQACIVAFEPAWLLIADRFPSPCPGRVIIDPYLVMLMDASDRKKTFASTGDAFATAESQKTMVAALKYADIAVLGSRGSYQLNEASKMQLSRDFGLQPINTAILTYSKRESSFAR